MSIPNGLNSPSDGADPNCPHCHGQGYTMVDAPFGGVDVPSYAKPMTCVCKRGPETKVTFTTTHELEREHEIGYQRGLREGERRERERFQPIIAAMPDHEYKRFRIDYSGSEECEICGGCKLLHVVAVQLRALASAEQEG